MMYLSRVRRIPPIDDPKEVEDGNPSGAFRSPCTIAVTVYTVTGIWA